MSSNTAEKNDGVVEGELMPAFDTKNVPACFGKADLIIIALEERCKDLTEIEPGNVKQYKAVVEGIKDARTTRTGFEGARTITKSGALEFGRAVDAYATTIKDRVSITEDRLKLIKEAEDNRVEAIRLEAERVERERVEKIQFRIEVIKSVGVEVTSDTALDVLEGARDSLNLTVINTEYEELAGVANEALLNAKDIVGKAIEFRKQRDEEDRQREVHAAELAKQQKEIDDKKAAQDKEDEDRTERIRVEDAERQTRIDAENNELAAKKKIIDDEAARVQADKDAEEQRIRDEQAEITRKEEAEKADRQKKADKKAEIERLRREHAERQEKLVAAREEAVSVLSDALIASTTGEIAGFNDAAILLASRIIDSIERGEITGIKAEYL